MLRSRLYLAVVGSHFAVDTLNSLGAVLLAVLAGPLLLSNAQIGFALTLYLLMNALSQPLFGWLADRMPNRAVLLASLGVAWLALFFGVVALVQNWIVLLLCFAIAPLGSGLFHPIGTASAAAAVPDRANSATAVFFFGGQMGLALGPMIGGLLLGRIGSLGVLPLAMLALIPAGLLFTVRNMPFPLPEIQPSPDDKQLSGPALKRGIARWLSVAVPAFMLLVAVRSSIQTAYQSFLPKLFDDRGWDPVIFGILAGTFMGAAAIGNIVMGSVADRLGLRAATVLPLLFSVPAGLLCLHVPWLPLIFLGAALAGFLVGGQHSVLVVHAQQLLPMGQRFAAGLILGFTFASGAFGAWLVGIAADWYSLPTVMQVVAWCGGIAALLALTLPGRQARPRQTSHEPVAGHQPESTANL